jgi:hypothetical protein
VVDGEPIDAKSLEVPEGEVVLMSGSQDGSGFTVDHVSITHLLDAPVEAIDTEHGRMTILGQTVLLNSLSCTQISCIDPSTVPGVGDRILVSGYLLGAPGQMLATRVAPSVASGDYLITGGRRLTAPMDNFPWVHSRSTTRKRRCRTFRGPP